jgi:hypothetical protein
MPPGARHPIMNFFLAQSGVAGQENLAAPPYCTQANARSIGEDAKCMFVFSVKIGDVIRTAAEPANS